MDIFSRLPLSQFTEEIFERRPHVFRGLLPADLYSFGDLDQALTASMSSNLPFAIGLNGVKPNPREYCTDVRNDFKKSDTPEIDPAKDLRFIPINQPATVTDLSK